tara:strand:- start:671 stop:1078 length:408 start_codon:yes stop_codon:yes gene_type:complete
MNDPISWDPSLVKKFSTSNHYKLLNQLRTEVTKYPLNNKKKITSIKNQVQNIEINSNLSKTDNETLASKTNLSNEVNTNNSTVSFNNAKNFSIYKQATNNDIGRIKKSPLSDQPKSNEDSTSLSFKERLNQIDLK